MAFFCNLVGDSKCRYQCFCLIAFLSVSGINALGELSRRLTLSRFEGWMEYWE